MHVDMVDNVRDPNSNYIYRLVAAIESACYPNYGGSIAATPVTLQVANNIKIRGIISSVNTTYDGPLLDMTDTDIRSIENDMIYPKYAMVDVSFSVTEVTGNSWSRADICSLGGWR